MCRRCVLSAVMRGHVLGPDVVTVMSRLTPALAPRALAPPTVNRIKFKPRHDQCGAYWKATTCIKCHVH